MSALKPYLQLVRAPAVFTAASNIGAAHLVATGGEIEWPALALLVASSVALLAAGMALNDCFDLEIDRRERPGRPLPSGQIAPGVAWSLGFGLLAAGVALAGLVGPRSLAVAALLALAIVLYDGLLKSGPLGPQAMALCRYLNWALGLSIVAVSAFTLAVPLPLFFYVCAITYLSRTEAGPGDRRLVAVAIAFLGLAAAAFLALTVAGVYSIIWVLALAGAAFAAAGGVLAKTYREFSPAKAQAAVGLLLLGIIPLDVLMALANGLKWAVVLLLLMLPGKWLGRRLYMT